MKLTALLPFKHGFKRDLRNGSQSTFRYSPVRATHCSVVRQRKNRDARAHGSAQTSSPTEAKHSNADGQMEPNVAKTSRSTGSCPRIKMENTHSHSAKEKKASHTTQVHSALDLLNCKETFSPHLPTSKTLVRQGFGQ